MPALNTAFQCHSRAGPSDAFAVLAVSMLQRARQNYAGAQLRQADAMHNRAVPMLGTALLRQCFARPCVAAALPVTPLPVRR